MKNEITYTEINGINYPNHTLPEQPNVNIGKYGHILIFVASCGDVERRRFIIVVIKTFLSVERSDSK